MKSRQQRIHDQLVETFAPKHIEIDDESASHAGHAGAKPGGETHYRILIVAECFRGKSRVTAQKRNYVSAKVRVRGRSSCTFNKG